MQSTLVSLLLLCCVLCIDGRGQLAPLWLRSEGGSGFDRPSRVATFADGSYAVFGDASGAPVIAGNPLPPDDDPNTNFVAAYAADGTPRWSAAIHLDGFGYLFVGLEAEPDGSFLVATSYTLRLRLYDAVNVLRHERVGQGANSKGIVLRYGRNGTVDIVCELGPAAHATSYCVLRDLHRDASGALTLVGHFFGTLHVDDTVLSTTQGEEAFVLQWRAGRMRWGAQVNGRVGPTIPSRAARAELVTGLPDGSVVVAGYYNGELQAGGTVLPEGLYRRFLLRYDVDGALQWARLAVWDRFERPLLMTTDLVGRSDGKVVLTGWCDGGDVVFGDNPAAPTVVRPYATAFVACFDAGGAADWVHHSLGGITFALGASLLPDDGVALAGFYRQSLSFTTGESPVVSGVTQNRPWLARFDATGQQPAVLLAGSGALELQDVASAGNRLVAVGLGAGTVTVQGLAANAGPGGDAFHLGASAGPNGNAYPNLVLRQDLVAVEALDVDRIELAVTVLNTGRAAAPPAQLQVRVDGFERQLRSQQLTTGTVPAGGSATYVTELRNVALEEIASVVAVIDARQSIVEDDPATPADEEADNEVVVSAGVFWTRRYATGFEDSVVWQKDDEIIDPASYAATGLLTLQPGSARTGGHGLELLANGLAQPKSNNLIAFHRAAETSVDGLWRFSFWFRLPDDPTFEGQAAPTFTFQNTRFTNGPGSPTRTAEAGFQYWINPYDRRHYQKWGVWVNGSWRVVSWGPRLDLGVWYRVTFVVDFTQDLYRQLIIEAPGDPAFTTVRRTLNHRIPSVQKQDFDDDAFVISVEAENLWTGGARVTRYRLDVDDVVLEQARTR